MIAAAFTIVFLHALAVSTPTQVCFEPHQDLPQMQKIFDLELSLEDATASGKLINEAGLRVAFVVYGDCAPVQDAHKALVAALEKGEGIAETGKARQAQILKNEAKLRAFAGI